MINLLRNLTHREWLLLLVALSFIVVEVWLDLTLPDYMSIITTLVETQGTEIGEIWHNGLFMLLCTFGSMIATVITTYCVARIAAGLSTRVREKLFSKVLSFSATDINKFSTPSLITRTTNDITQVQMLVGAFSIVIIKAPILIIWAISKIANKQWQWTLATAIAVVIVLIITIIITSIAFPKFKIIQRLTDNINRLIRENLLGIRVVRAYNAENYQQRKFDKANTELTTTQLYTSRLMALLAPTITLISSGLSLSIYWIGMGIIMHSPTADKLPIFSDMVVFSAYALQILSAFVMLSAVFAILPRVMVSVKRINEVLISKLNITSNNINEDFAKGKMANHIKKIEFRNIFFRYPENREPTLSDISFTVVAGETLAIVGATASGKSSLVNLIPRFYDVSSGEILIDDIPLCEYNIQELRHKIGYVAQKAVLFSGDVSHNVTYGSRKIEETAVRKALEIAQATEFVDQMSANIQSDIARDGTNISGGQKQRLSIARAIYKEPDIYIFDDAFSALDYKTDRALRKALSTEVQSAIKIIVAQRIGTILDANRIVVLDEGHIVGIGTHSELMESCSIYRNFAISQLSKEELNNV